MKRFARNRNGQFVIIAVLMTAVMMISIGALMHEAVSYYKQEPWEEYSTLIGDIELGSSRLVEVSLVNYTNTDPLNSGILGANLQKWQEDLSQVYRSSGITFSFSNHNVANVWDQPVSTSSATCDFTLNISSIGLKGYKFTSVAFLSLRSINYTSINATASEANVVVRGDNNLPVTELKASDFRVNGTIPIRLTSYYDPTHAIIYKLTYNATATPNKPVIEVWDHRGIRVVGSPP